MKTSYSRQKELHKFELLKTQSKIFRNESPIDQLYNSASENEIRNLMEARIQDQKVAVAVYKNFRCDSFKATINAEMYLHLRALVY